MLKFSANLGFLWSDLYLPDRIRAAAGASFDAVECHFPYDTPVDEVVAALGETGLEMIGINTVLGAPGSDDFGVAAMVGREEEARGYIDQALNYAAQIGCHNVNVVPGKTGRKDGSEETFRQNLLYACDTAATHGVTIVIEPINQRSAPNFHLSQVADAAATVEAVGKDNLKIMFDCFHTQIMDGDLAANLERHLPQIGHIQISAVHDRGEPDRGEINYPFLFEKLDELGYNGLIGAEYHARGSVEAGLGWLKQYRSSTNRGA